MYKGCGIIWVILLIAALSACGGSNKDVAAGTTENEDSGVIDQGAAGSAGDTGGSGNTSKASCGNGKVDTGEKCDDGNADDNDGCTNLCEYSCSKDNDCSTSDPCAGAGIKCDATTHACTSGEGKKPDNTPCGDNASCQNGKCTDFACNNGHKELTEECDDGNADDNDGCNRKCRYSCVSSDKKRNCINDCDLYATCDDSNHTCKASDKTLGDNAICNNGTGYCLNGQCIEAKCGDGIVQPNEECDNGKTNTDTIASGATNGCTAKCTKAVCGNGKIEEKEQCDDGSNTNLDGCDSMCRVELVFAGSQMRMVEEPAPDFCMYSKKNYPQGTMDGNAMGKMFASMKRTMQNLIDEGALNDITDKMVAGSDRLFLFHLIDVDDPTLSTEDKFIKIGESMAMADNMLPDGGPIPDGGRYTQISMANRIDWPVQVWRQHFDDAGLPKTIIFAEIAKDGNSTRTQTTKPATVGFHTNPIQYDGGSFPGGDFYVRNIRMQLPIDGVRNRIKTPATADWVQIPSTSGGFDMTATKAYSETSTASGVMCGAIDSKMFSTMPLPADAQILGPFTLGMAEVCPDQANDPVAKTKIKGCANGKDSLDKGECGSMADLLLYGCTGSGIVEITPLGPPDVDTDGDGKTDGYSMVSKIAAMRVTMSKHGFRADEPMGYPIGD